MIGDFRGVLESIPNDQLRAQLNDYLARVLPEDPDKKEFDKAVVSTIIKFPQYIDYFIKLKEENGDQAVKLSELKVNETRSEEHTSELQSRPHLVCRLLLEKK